MFFADRSYACHEKPSASKLFVLRGFLLIGLLSLSLNAKTATVVPSSTDCPAGPLYLSFEPGNMQDATAIAALLKRRQIPAAFFLSNSPTTLGDDALDVSWGPYWRALAAQGHTLGANGFDGVYFAQENEDGSLSVKPRYGKSAGKTITWSANEVCSDLRRVQRRYASLTDARLAPFWQATDSKTTALVLRAARACGFHHVSYSSRGVIDSVALTQTSMPEKFVAPFVTRLRADDVIHASLGDWRNRQPFTPVLEVVLDALREHGFCFRNLQDRELEPAAPPPVRYDPQYGETNDG